MINGTTGRTQRIWKHTTVGNRTKENRKKKYQDGFIVKAEQAGRQVNCVFYLYFRFHYLIIICNQIIGFNIFHFDFSFHVYTYKVYSVIIIVHVLRGGGRARERKTGRQELTIYTQTDCYKKKIFQSIA